MHVNSATPTETVGFDLGHGESALAIAMMSATTEPQILEIQSERAFITAVAIHPTRGVIIGGDAYAARELDSLHVGFKSPHLDKPEIREAITLFVRRTLELLQSEHKIKGNDDTQFIVGCPSGWDQETRAQYADLLRESGLSNVKLIAESRAAFLHAKEANELRVSYEQLAGSVFIVDIGSSTTDFTAVVNFKEYYIDFGHMQLGAGLIDKAILEHALQRHEQRANLEKVFQSHPQYQAMCELRCRKAKEMLFANEERYRYEPAVETLRIPTTPRILFEAELTTKDMDEILATPLAALDQRTWPDVFRDALLRAKDRLTDHPPDIILLTGGGSRMQFTVRICEEIFPDARLVRGIEPQFAVAKGLAWAGRIDRKAQSFLEEVQDLVQSNQVEQKVQAKLPSLLSAFADHLAVEVPRRFIMPAFEEWRKGKIRTLADLEPNVENRIRTWLNSAQGKEDMAPTVLNWLETVRPEIEKLTNPICDKYSVPRTAMALPSWEGFEGRLPDGLFNPTTIIGLNEFAAIVSVIVSAIGGTLAGGAGTAFLLHGPIGWVIGFAITLFAMAMGYGRALEWVRTAEIPVLVRKLVRRKTIESKLSRKERELKEKMLASIRSHPQSLETIASEISRSIEEQLKKSADRILVMIR
jgi:hypothetical protein